MFPAATYGGRVLSKMIRSEIGVILLHAPAGDMRRMSLDVWTTGLL